MHKWKDTAITLKEITKSSSRGEEIVLSENTLVIIEKELSNESYLVSDTNPRKNERRTYKLSFQDIKINDYAISRDINIQMLLADGWDARDLLSNP